MTHTTDTATTATTTVLDALQEARSTCWAEATRRNASDDYRQEAWTAAMALDDAIHDLIGVARYTWSTINPYNVGRSEAAMHAAIDAAERAHEATDWAC